MPDMPGINDLAGRPDSFKRVRKGVLGFVDVFGGTKNATIRTYGNDLTRGELDAIRNACGDASNAGIYFDDLQAKDLISVTDARAINDMFGAVSTYATFIFERSDNDQLVERFVLPAPKKAMLAKGEVEWFVDTESALAQAIINACESGFNSGIPDGEPNYRFVRALLTDGQRKKIGGNKVPNEVDPVI